MKKVYSLVIPCFNEAETLPFLIQRIAEGYADKSEFEIILVDNGSSDNTPELLSQAIKTYPDTLKTTRVEVNQGYGWGILQGLALAEGEYLGWTHADMQTDPKDALAGFALLEKLHGQYAFVKGKRYGRPWADVFFTMGMSCFDSMLFGLPLWDINAQPTLFNRAFYKILGNPPRDFALDLYVYAMAKKNKAEIDRFPVLFAQRQFGKSHWNINWKAKLKFIKRTIDFSLTLKKSWR